MLQSDRWRAKLDAAGPSMARNGRKAFCRARPESGQPKENGADRPEPRQQRLTMSGPIILSSERAIQRRTKSYIRRVIRRQEPPMTLEQAALTDPCWWRCSSCVLPRPPAHRSCRDRRIALRAMCSVFILPTGVFAGSLQAWWSSPSSEILLVTVQVLARTKLFDSLAEALCGSIGSLADVSGHSRRPRSDRLHLDLHEQYRRLRNHSAAGAAPEHARADIPRRRAL